MPFSQLKGCCAVRIEQLHPDEGKLFGVFLSKEDLLESMDQPVDLVVESSYVLSRRKAEIETESTVNVSTHPSVLPPDLQGTYNSPHHVMGLISLSASLGICDSQASGWDSLFFVDSSCASIRSMRITVDSAMQ